MLDAGEDPLDGEKLLAVYQATSLEGVSGSFSFDSNGDRLGLSAKVYNTEKDGANIASIGTIVFRTGGADLTFTNNETTDPLYFPGGLTAPPPARDDTPHYTIIMAGPVEGGSGMLCNVVCACVYMFSSLVCCERTQLHANTNTTMLLSGAFTHNPVSLFVA